MEEEGGSSGPRAADPDHGQGGSRTGGAKCAECRSQALPAIGKYNYAKETDSINSIKTEELDEDQSADKRRPVPV